jgi:uncharacterized integral membrane protein
MHFSLRKGKKTHLEFLGYTGERPLGVIVIGSLAGAFLLAGTLLFSRYPADE